MTQDLIYLIGLIVSSAILSEAFGTKIKSRKTKIAMLLLGDSGLIASHIFYAYNRVPHTVVSLIIFAMINALILWRIFCKETAEQQTRLT